MPECRASLFFVATRNKYLSRTMNTVDWWPAQVCLSCCVASLVVSTWTVLQDLLNLTAKAVYEVIHEIASPSSSHPSVRFHNLLGCAGSFFLSSVKTESLGWFKLKDNLLKKRTESNIWAETETRSRKMGTFWSVSLPSLACWDCTVPV